MPAFEYVRDDYEFALNHINDMNQQNKPGREVPDALGEHLFIYYVRGVFPMTGAGSLLDSFYHQFAGERERWATLFDYVGRELSSTGKHQLDKSLRMEIASQRTERTPRVHFLVGGRMLGSRMEIGRLFRDSRSSPSSGFKTR